MLRGQTLQLGISLPKHTPFVPSSFLQVYPSVLEEWKNGTLQGPGGEERVERRDQCCIRT